jgi:hypothetical protein
MQEFIYRPRSGDRVFADRTSEFRSPNAAPVETYAGLLNQPGRSGADDGAVILWAGDMHPQCADCRRGHLRWAEGGYVPWHRICDVCGSHWDLHPITWGVTRLDDGTLARWIDGNGYAPLDPTGPLAGSGKTWRDFLALITQEMWATAAEPDRRRQMADSVTVCGAWARRARFY